MQTSSVLIIPLIQNIAMSTFKGGYGDGVALDVRGRRGTFPRTSVRIVSATMQMTRNILSHVNENNSKALSTLKI